MKLTRFLKVASLFFLVGLVVERSYRCLMQFLENPTYTETTTVRQYHAELPAMSICPLYNGYKTNVLEASCK